VEHGPTLHSKFRVGNVGAAVLWQGRRGAVRIIDFAIGAPVTEAFRGAVWATAEADWKPLVRSFDGKPQEMDQGVGVGPATSLNWAGHSRKRPDSPIPGDR
jgi:hypothetical protein